MSGDELVGAGVERPRLHDDKNVDILQNCALVDMYINLRYFYILFLLYMPR